MPLNLVTQAEYARIRGVTKGRVSQAAKAGIITLVVGPDGRHLVDVDAANLSWAARTDNAQQQRGAIGQVGKTQTLARGSAAKKAAARGARTSAPSTPELPKTQDLGLGLSLIEEKTRSERLRIQRQEIDLAERRGQLVSLAAMEAAWSVKLIEARELLESIPDRFSAVFAAELDPRVIHRLLLDELRHAMTLAATESMAGAH